eukprot:9828082-Karenia_brevis.AAC.1
MNAARERQLRVAQRRMLRWMLGSGRKTLTSRVDDQCSDESDSELPEPPQDEEEELETWADWLSRTTHQVEEQLRQCNIEDWV